MPKLDFFYPIKGIAQAIFTSVFTFPSCAYWGCSLSILIIILLALILTYMATDVLVAPNIVLYLENESLLGYFRMSMLLSSGFLIIINYYVRDYYTRSHQTSDEFHQKLLKKYLIFLHSFSFLYILFFFLATFGGKRIGFLKEISFSLFFFTHPIIHIAQKSIVRLKHTTRRMNGLAFINLEFLATLFGTPIYLFCSWKEIKYGHLFSASSNMLTFAYVLNGLSFIYDAITVLGHRFIKYNRYYAPYAFGKKKVSVHV